MRGRGRRLGACQLFAELRDDAATQEEDQGQHRNRPEKSASTGITALGSVPD